MLTLLAIYLNSSKLITGIISGLLTKFHGEIKKNYGQKCISRGHPTGCFW